MKNICRHVGSQIRFFRKLRGFTLKEFAAQLNKSVSTLSKYESGDISIDIFTLSEIARTLEVTIEQLLPTDYIDTSDQADDSLFSLDNRHFFAQKDMFYMYYPFSSNRKAPNKGITVNVIEIKRNKDAPDEIYLYSDCEMPESNYRKSKYVYHGNVFYYDFVVYFLLENVYHAGCWDYICAKVPFKHTYTTTGLYTGLSESLRNPSVTKVIISTTLLEPTDELYRELDIADKDTFYDLKHRNSLIIR